SFCLSTVPMMEAMPMIVSRLTAKRIELNSSYNRFEVVGGVFKSAISPAATIQVAGKMTGDHIARTGQLTQALNIVRDCRHILVGQAGSDGAHHAGWVIGALT